MRVRVEMNKLIISAWYLTRANPTVLIIPYNYFVWNFIVHVFCVFFLFDLYFKPTPLLPSTNIFPVVFLYASRRVGLCKHSSSYSFKYLIMKQRNSHDRIERESPALEKGRWGLKPTLPSNIGPSRCTTWPLTYSPIRWHLQATLTHAFHPYYLRQIHSIL